MIMVRVRLKEGQEAIGLLVDTHLMPVQGPPQVTMHEGVLTPTGGSQKGLRGFGVVAVEGGFLVGPLESMTPIFNPQEELSDGGEQPAEGEGEQPAPEEVQAELRPGEGREGEGE